MNEELLEKLLNELYISERNLKSDVFYLDTILKNLSQKPQSKKMISENLQNSTNSIVQLKLPSILEDQISNVLLLAKSVDKPIVFLNKYEKKEISELKIEKKMQNLQKHYLTNKPKKMSIQKNIDKITTQVQQKSVSIKPKLEKEVIPLHKPKNEAKIEIIVDKKALQSIENNHENQSPIIDHSNKYSNLIKINEMNNNFISSQIINFDFSHFDVERELGIILSQMFDSKLEFIEKSSNNFNALDLKKAFIFNRIFKLTNFFQILLDFVQKIEEPNFSQSNLKNQHEKQQFFEMRLMCLLIYNLLKKSKISESKKSDINQQFCFESRIIDKWEDFLNIQQKSTLSRKDFESILFVLRQIHIFTTHKNCIFLIK